MKVLHIPYDSFWINNMSGVQVKNERAKLINPPKPMTGMFMFKLEHPLINLE